MTDSNNTTFDESEIIHPEELPSEIAGLIVDAERMVEIARAQEKADQEREQAEMDAFVVRRTKEIVAELGDNIPEALRPFIVASDPPIAKRLATENWVPKSLKFAIPGVNHFLAKLDWDNHRGRHVIEGFYVYNYHHEFKSLQDALVESRRAYIVYINNHNANILRAKLKTELRQQEERQPTTAERLVALIEEIATRKVAELLEV